MCENTSVIFSATAVVIVRACVLSWACLYGCACVRVCCVRRTNHHPTHGAQADTLTALISYNKEVVGHILGLHYGDSATSASGAAAAASAAETADSPRSTRSAGSAASLVSPGGSSEGVRYTRLTMQSMVDYLFRFYGNELVYDVLCYCLADRLETGVASVRTVLFFLPQILVRSSSGACCGEYELGDGRSRLSILRAFVG